MSNKIYIIRWTEIDSSGEASGGVTSSAFYNIDDARNELETLKNYEIDNYINSLGYDEDYVKECTRGFMYGDGFIIQTDNEQTSYIIEEMEVK